MPEYYVSDICGKSMRNVIKSISIGETDPDKLAILVHTRTKNKHVVQTIKEPLTGIVSPLDKAKIGHST